jgi:two-component sensor histidine kinase
VQTLKGARSVEEAREAFEARLMALSGAHNILTRENWGGGEPQLRGRGSPRPVPESLGRSARCQWARGAG